MLPRLAVSILSGIGGGAANRSTSELLSSAAVVVVDPRTGDATPAAGGKGDDVTEGDFRDVTEDEEAVAGIPSNLFMWSLPTEP